NHNFVRFRPSGDVLSHAEPMKSRSLQLWPVDGRGFRWWGSWLLAVGVLASASAQISVPTNQAKTPSPALQDFSEVGTKFSFKLRPKSFQQNPDLNLTVITQITKEGKGRPEVTPENPAYYGMQSRGMAEIGGGSAGKLAVPLEKIRQLIQTALGENGFL